MKTKTRNILLVIGAILLVFAGLAGYAGYRMYSFFSEVTGGGEIPAELKEPKILKGGELVEKSEFFKLKKESFLKTIIASSQIRDKEEQQRKVHSEMAKGLFGFDDIKVFGSQVIAAGSFGAYVFDSDGNLKKEILFQPTKEKIKIAGFEQDTYQASFRNLQIVEPETGRYGFSSYDSQQGFRLFNEDGNEAWAYGQERIDPSIIWQDEKEREKQYEASQHVLEAAVGDLDNDGTAEYIIARKRDGIHAFSKDGQQRWFTPDDLPNSPLVVLDFDGDGKNEVLVMSRLPKLISGDGKTIREFAHPLPEKISLYEDDRQNKSLLLCRMSENVLVCEDGNSQNAFTAPVPLSNVASAEKGSSPYSGDREHAELERAVLVDFSASRKKYLAVLTSFGRFPRAQFYLFDKNKQLIYQEILSENAETLAVVPSSDGTRQILIGGRETIWKYRLK